MRFQFSLATLIICTSILAVVAAISATAEVRNENYVADGELYRAPYATEVLGQMAIRGPMALAAFFCGRWAIKRVVYFCANYETIQRKPEIATACLLAGVVSAAAMFSIRAGPCSEPIVFISAFALLLFSGLSTGVGLGILCCRSIAGVVLCGICGTVLLPLVLMIIASNH